MAKVEFAGLGLFLTLGNMTPRFLAEDLCAVDVLLVDIPEDAVELRELFEPLILLIELLK